MIKTYLLPLLCLLALLSSCDKNNNSPNYAGDRELHLTYADGTMSQTIKLDDTATVHLIIKSSVKGTTDLKLDLKLEGIEGATLTPSSVTLPAGQISTKVELTVSKKHLFDKETGTLTLTGIPEKTQLKNTLALILEPKVIVKLSEHDRQLLSTWRRDLGINLLPFIGEMVCDGVIKEPGGGNPEEYFANPREVQIKDQVMTVAISKNATAAQPMLEFTSNALGLAAYYKEIWLKRTILNREEWNEGSEYAPPSPKIIMRELNWKPEDPVEFDLSLVNIRVDPKDKTNLVFTGLRAEAIMNDPSADLSNKDFMKKVYEIDPVMEHYPYPEKIMNLFQFHVPLWEKAIQMAKTKPELKEALISGNTDPYDVLQYSNVDSDGWMADIEDATITHYVQPKGTINYDQGTMHFVTVTDNHQSWGYTTIEITCRPKK